MAHSQMQEHIVFRWMSLKSTIEYLGEWEMLYNPNFNCTEFDTIRNASGGTSIIQANNYYPFGGLLKEGEHHWDIQNRFYNGKEYDRMQGLNLYDYSARQYDPAVCQFTSMDPLCEKYYHISPYAYCAGNPVKYVDPDGNYLAMYDENHVKWKYNIVFGAFEDTEGNLYKGVEDDYINTVTKCLNYLCEGEAGKELVWDLAQRKEGIGIVYNEVSSEHERFFSNNDGIKSVIRFNPEQEVESAKGGIILGHELAHSQDRLNGTIQNERWFDGADKTVTIAERYAMHWENLIREEHGVVMRQFYTGSNGRIYNLLKNECVSLYFETKYPINVNYKNKLPIGVKGYVYKSFK